MALLCTRIAVLLCCLSAVVVRAGHVHAPDTADDDLHSKGFSVKNLLSWHRNNASVALAGEPLHVFVVPHTHDDTGWQQTVDEYFINEVKWILDSVTAALGRSRSDDDPRYPKRIFSYVEMAFFERWWREQTDATKNRTRALVSTGLLEFNLAGWCMNDEAAPTYSRGRRSSSPGAP